MKKISAHSKTSLFLMEMIFVLLFLALSSAACIRIFAAAKKNHIQAQEWRHTISSNGTMTVPGNSVPIHRLPIK